MASYNVRILPASDWGELPGLDSELYDEELTNVMVVEHAGEIVAHWALLPVYHAEGLWVKEEFRKNPAIIRNLLAGMKTMAETVNAPFVVTMTQNKEVAKLLDKLPGSKILNGDFYAMTFED